MRLFIGLPLTPNVAAPLRVALAPLRKSMPGGRWSHPDDWHLTLAFLGEQPVERMAALHEVMRQAARGHASFTLPLGRLGWFAAGRLLALLPPPCEPLKALQTALARALCAVGLPVEERPFRAHVTLACWHGRPQDAALPAVPALSLPVSGLTLFENVAGQAPRYHALARQTLDAPHE